MAPKRNICECGATYYNFCIRCRRRYRQEVVESLMDRYKLDEENLVKILSEHVYEGNFPALSLAITMKDMKPGSKQEVTGTEGGPIELREAQNRLADILANIIEQGGQGEGDSSARAK